MPAEATVRTIREEPYPGLRPFEPEESLLFFGRGEHTKQLLARLAHDRLLAVVGSSGSGKSSLVRAGLLPSLYRGYLADAGTRWRIAIMRPGNQPLDELAETLAAPDVLGGDPPALRQALGRSTYGLLDVVDRSAAAGKWPDGEKLLIVVDQFEELFRYQTSEAKRRGPDAAAHLFVSSLLEVTARYDARVYVVLTMRSDFLGDCAQFPGLPEALNDSQYLIPRLTRAERQEAVEGPLRMAGVRMKPWLVQHLLNVTGEDPDQLPVLQHSLTQTFRLWKQDHDSAEIEFHHYERAGAENALDTHAGRLYDEILTSDEQTWAEQIFRCLTTLQDGRAVRRPSRLDHLYLVAGAIQPDERKAVNRVIEVYSARENSLLVLTRRGKEEGAAVVDISHESLIRKWKLLGKWIRLEGESAAWYRDVVRAVERRATGAGGLWNDPELSKTLDLQRRDHWNTEWAGQYVSPGSPAYPAVEQFLAESAAAQEEERRREREERERKIQAALALADAEKRAKKWYRWGVAFLIALVGAGAVAGFLAWKSQKAQEQVVALQAAVTDAAARTDRISQELIEKQALLESAPDSASQARLQTEVERLQSQYNQSQDRIRTAETQLKNVSSKSSSPDEALRQIATLQTQLRQAREERDMALKTAYESKAPDQKEAGYWKTMASDLDARLKKAEAALAAARPSAAVQRPVIVALPQLGFQYLQDSPFNGKAGLAVGDLPSSASGAAQLYLVIREDGQRFPVEFTGNEGRFRSLIGALSLPSGCSANSSPQKAGGEVWCFPVSRARVIAGTQNLGRFRFEGNAYEIVGAGWSPDARGDEDVLSVVIFPYQYQPAGK